MANTYITYEADGVNKGPFTVPFEYISKEHVKVYVDDVEDALFTWLSSSTIELSSVPPAGSTILIRRETPRDSLIVEIPNSGTFRGRDINAQSQQVLNIVAEAYDALVAVLSQDFSDGHFNAKGKRIKNVADPEDAQDAVTKNWAETAMTSQLQQATAAKDAAQSAKTAAESAANTATTKAGEASGSAAAAASSATAASNSANNAANSASAAAGSATTAGNHATTAGTYASAAQGYASDAAGHAQDAEEFADDASAAAIAAESLFDDFEKRYLGAFPSNPTQDSNGDPVQTGALYFNTTQGEMRVYSGSVWQVAYVPADELAASAIDFTPYGSIEAGNVQDAIEELDDTVGLLASDVSGLGQDVSQIQGDITDLQQNKLGVDDPIDADTFAGKQPTEFGQYAEPGAWSRQQYFSIATLADASTISWNLQTQQVAKVTIGGDRTLGAPTNPVEGAVYILIVAQDGTGGHVLGYNSAYQFAGGAPDIASDPNARTVLTFVYEGGVMRGVAATDFSA